MIRLNHSDSPSGSNSQDKMLPLTGEKAERPQLEPRVRLQLARRLDAIFPAGADTGLPDAFDELLREIAARLDR